MLCALFSRLYQIHQIWVSYTVRNQRLSKQRLQGIYFIFFFAIVGIQLIVEIVWSAADPFRSVLVPVSTVQLTSSYECTSNTFWVWAGLEIAYYALLLLWGVFLLYRTWDLKNDVGESRWLLIGVYNCIIVMTVSIPLAIVAPGEESYALLAGWGAFVAATSTVYLVMVPIAIARFRMFRGEKATVESPAETTVDTESEADAAPEVKELIEVARRQQTQRKIAAAMRAEEESRRNAGEGGMAPSWGVSAASEHDTGGSHLDQEMKPTELKPSAAHYDDPLSREHGGRKDSNSDTSRKASSSETGVTNGWVEL